MKIAVTTTGTTVDDALCQRFGRAPAFLVVDTETGEAHVQANTQNMNAAQGAGIQAGQTVVETGAEALITGHVGPKAFRVLQSAGIAVYTSDAATVKKALEAFASGDLSPQDDADVEGHWV